MFKKFFKSIILKKIRNTFTRYKMFISIASIMVLASILVVFLRYWQVPIVACPFRFITGYPCPGCGGIRATQAIFEGDILLALQLNPLSCLLFVFFVVMLFWSFYDGYKKQNTLKYFLVKKKNKYVVVICLVIILANWIWNIYKF